MERSHVAKVPLGIHGPRFAECCRARPDHCLGSIRSGHLPARIRVAKRVSGRPRVRTALGARASKARQLADFGALSLSLLTPPNPTAAAIGFVVLSFPRGSPAQTLRCWLSCFLRTRALPKKTNSHRSDREAGTAQHHEVADTSQQCGIWQIWNSSMNRAQYKQDAATRKHAQTGVSHELPQHLSPA